MAKRHLIKWVVLITLIIGWPAGSYGDFTEDEVDVYQNDEFLLLEEDPGQNRFFALVKKGNYYKYVQFNGYFNEVFSITNLFNLEDLSKSTSAIDPYNRRYFFTTTSDNQSILYVLSLDSGEILYKSSLEFKVNAMYYDEPSGSLIALAQNKNANSKTIRIDPHRGEVTRLADLSRTFSMDYDSAFYKEDQQEIWLSAANRKNEYLLTVSTVTGKANAIRVINVEPEKEIVYNFNTMKLNQVIFAAGTKHSIFLTGFNDYSKTAFVLHLTDSSRAVKDRITKINKQLLEYSPGGIADYELTVVCARPYENIVSFSKAIALERNLKAEYAIEKITHKEFFNGRPYKVVLTAEGVSIY
ncbi:MAG: hypothetical protein AB7S78_10650 [Candidatus Omnitrophota bacterium]